MATADRPTSMVPSDERPKLGFLHTAAVHVPTFDGLVGDVGADIVTAHSVRDDLLASARELGPDDTTVTAAVAAALDELTERGADLIVCTCSTISGVAEALRDGVVRIDRPLAERAVDLGVDIVVTVAVESTIGPTSDLFDEVAAERWPADGLGRIRTHVCNGAWDRFEAGDLDGYHAEIARQIDRFEPTVDVVVLGQASMAPAAALVTHPAAVLSSPPLAVEAAIARLLS